MRLENSARNVKAAWALQLVHILCQFISRTVIIKVLAIEYVGLSGLFSNVLMMLSLAELGIGEAIIFSMYGPIARGEKDNIGAIMAFYKKVYITVGLFVMFAGLAITPWIGVFIKEMPNIPEIYWIYALYVINSSVSYFFSYKAAFLTANQNNYLVVVNNGLWEIGMVAVQVAILFATQNYIAYMIVGIVFVLAQNISISTIADRRYPYLKARGEAKDGEVVQSAETAATTNSKPGKIPKEIFDQIKKNTAAMVFHKIGYIIVFATDNLILSKFVGLVSVGIYANYCTLTNAVTLFISKFFNAISASIGNLAATETVEKQEETLFKVFFINFWLYTFCCCCLFNLMNPFIADIWIGDEFLFGEAIVLLIVIKIYFSGMRGAAQTFKNAKGLYWQNRYMPIYESLINLAASLVLVYNFGVAGVLLGTIISSVLTCVWIEPHVLYKYGFEKSATKFYGRYLAYLGIFAGIMAVTYVCNGLVFGSEPLVLADGTTISVLAEFDGLLTASEGIGGWLDPHGFIVFVLKCVLNAVLPNILMIAIFFKTKEFAYVVSVAKRFIKK